MASLYCKHANFAHRRRARYARVASAALAAALGAGVGIGCSAPGRLRAAEAAAAQFHARVWAGQTSAAYSMTDPVLRGLTSGTRFTKIASLVRSRLGAEISVRPAGGGINYQLGGALATLRYRIEFQQGTAGESLVWSFGPDGPRLRKWTLGSAAFVGVISRPRQASSGNADCRGVVRSAR